MIASPELLSTGLSAEEAHAWSIFQPYGTDKLSELIRDRTRLVHYTSAEVAVSILRSRQIWMRRSAALNDFSEIEHGVALLSHTFQNTEAGKNFVSLLDEVCAGCAHEAINLIDQGLNQDRASTYLTCLSAHHSARGDDLFGRLSMWRAYGGSAGVALVLNQDIFTQPNNNIGAWSAAVAYFDQDAMAGEFARVNERIADNRAFLGQLKREDLRDAIYGLIQTRLVATKHPGFREEDEWRVIHSPTKWASSHLQSDVEVVRGVPQTVYKIPLRDDPDLKIEGLEIPALLNSIIIGPSEDSYTIAEALVRVLREEVGIEDPWPLIRISDIPLRTP